MAAWKLGRFERCLKAELFVNWMGPGVTHSDGSELTSSNRLRNSWFPHMCPSLTRTSGLPGQTDDFLLLENNIFQILLKIFL